MGRIYTAPIDRIAVAADDDQDLWSLMAPSGRKLILHAWEITASITTPTIMATVLQRITAVGSGGAALTAVKVNSDDSAAIGSARRTDTTPGASGDALEGYQWEMVGALGQIFTPELRPIIQASTGIALKCKTSQAFTMSGYIKWEEN